MSYKGFTKYEHKEVPKNSDELRFNCVFCDNRGKGADTKFHLYVNFKKHTFICFRCSTKGTLRELRKFLDFGIERTPVIPNLEYLKDKVNNLFTLKANPPIELDLISMPMEEAPIAQVYLERRGFSKEEIERYDLRVGKTYTDPKTKRPVKRWSGRILFPFKENGEVIYVVGRTYTGNDIRYVNSLGSKDRVIYGIDGVKGTCILCEGIISSIAAERTTGVPSVSILGKTISKYQIAKLKFKAETIYVCLDGTEDVTQEVRDKLNRDLIQAGFKVFEIKLPHGDPDDLKGEFKHYFDQARRVII